MNLADLLNLSSALTRRGLLRWPAALALAQAGCAAVKPASPALVAPFSASPGIDILPTGWHPYILRRDLAPTEYRVVSLDGHRVLYAGGSGVSSGLRCAVRADPADTPWLRWQWRVDSVPEAMCVAKDDTDDSPARVIVAFEGDTNALPLRDRAFFDLVELITGRRLPYATLMYVWDAQLPVGTVVSYARTSRIRYLVVESGSRRTGRWNAYERDLRDDFRRAFGEAPGPIDSVGVMTDSDDLKVAVDAWYSDIGLFAA